MRTLTPLRYELPLGNFAELLHNFSSIWNRSEGEGRIEETKVENKDYPIQRYIARARVWGLDHFYLSFKVGKLAISGAQLANSPILTSSHFTVFFF